MILIADSGATKTSWALLNDKNPIIHNTAGFNPYYMGSEVIQDILDKEMLPEISGAHVREIYYYGSGCSTSKNCAIVIDALKQHFPNATIEVQHDLLAAARALLGRNEGIACILGTGSNSCEYDGEKITANVPSLGYMFGDEGSGTYIGKRFLSAYLKGYLAEEINISFQEAFNYSLEDILTAVYNDSNPGKFMSTFTRFLASHEHDDDVREILLSSFLEFFEENVAKYVGYKMVPVSFVGSVAYHFRHILNEAAWQMGISIGRIEQAPMEGLIRYHGGI